MNGNQLLGPYIRTFFEDYLTCRRNMTINTIRSYRDGIKLFLGFTAKASKKPVTSLQVTDVKEAMILQFLKHLETERSNAIQTRNQRLIAVRRLFAYIAGQEPVLLDPCQRIVSIPLKRGAEPPPVRYLSQAEMTALLAAPDRTTALGQRNHALLLFLYNTGARVQEAADLKLAWLSLRPPAKVDIFGKGRKWRTCPLWNETARTLRQYIEMQRRGCGSEDTLFVNRLAAPLTRAGIENIVGRCRTQAAKTTQSLGGRDVTPHTIRHTTAMHLLQSGVEMNVIRAWLGHVSVATTDHYVNINFEMKAQALKTCEAVAGTGRPRRWIRPHADVLAWLKTL
ncbi:MAG: tyrosine-type recombinase/integrase [Planctomycetota bacterium]|nr:tyrosine-type recombinase/integrase [Planctomycetota bacterium]